MSPKRSTFTAAPLPRGRHGLSQKFVRASQRERVVKSMMALVAERGYAATTVPDVVALARVSRNAFYEFFEDKEECFLAACEEAAADLFATMETFGIEEDWVQGVRRGMRTFLQWWQDRPGMARAYLVELPSAGVHAVEQRSRAYALFERMFTLLGERIRRDHLQLPPLPDFVPRILVIALLEFLAVEVRTHGVAKLAELDRPALFIMVKLLADDATAHATLATRSAPPS